jgi:hypothetical protein
MKGVDDFGLGGLADGVDALAGGEVGLDSFSDRAFGTG